MEYHSLLNNSNQIIKRNNISPFINQQGVSRGLKLKAGFDYVGLKRKKKLDKIIFKLISLIS